MLKQLGKFAVVVGGGILAALGIEILMNSTSGDTDTDNGYEPTESTETTPMQES